MSLTTLARKGRGGNPILTLKKIEQPPVGHSPLPSAKTTSHTEILPENQGLTAIERFESALWLARNEWDIHRRSIPVDADGWLRGGAFAGMGRIDKTQADRLWTKAKTAFAGAGAQ